MARRDRRRRLPHGSRTYTTLRAVSASGAVASLSGSRFSLRITVRSRSPTTSKPSGAKVIQRSKKSSSASIPSTRGDDSSPPRNRARAPTRDRFPSFFEHEHDYEHEHEGEV